MHRIIVLLFVFVSMVTGQAFAFSINVSVRPETTIQAAQITLGDVAVITGDDQSKISQLRQLKLGNSALPGNRLVLTADLFTARLMDAGADLYNIGWQIPPMVTINTAGQVVNAESLTTKAEQAIRQRLSTGTDNADASITAIGVLQDVFAPIGTLTFKVELPYGIKLRAPTTANVIIYAGGVLYKVVDLKFDVKVYRNIIVASHNIAAQECVTPDSIRTERWDISRLTGYITDASKVNGLIAKRSINAGAPLMEGAFEKPLIVKRGSAVTIIAKTGDVIVSTSGVAMQDGSEGALIRVKNLSSNKVVNATVINDETVEVIIYNGR